MAVRIAVPVRAFELAGLADVDYADAFAAKTVQRLSAREWGEVIVTSAPTAVTGFVRVAHRRVVLLPEDDRLVIATVLRHENRAAPTIWKLGGFAHRAVARYLVDHAVRSAATAAAAALR